MNEEAYQDLTAIWTEARAAVTLLSDRLEIMERRCPNLVANVINDEDKTVNKLSVSDKILVAKRILDILAELRE